MTLLLVAALVSAGAGVTRRVSPAPGSHFGTPGNVLTTGGAVILNTNGIGELPEGAAFKSSSLRFYSVRPTGSLVERIFYFPATYCLVEVPLELPLGRPASGGELVVKRQGSTWRDAEAFPLAVEPGKASLTIAKFAVTRGVWDCVLLFPGSTPVFRLGLQASGRELKLGAERAQPASRIKARIKDARSGITPDHWQAFATPFDAVTDLATAAYFEQRPIAADDTDLDYACVPPGRWHLRIDSPDHASLRRDLPYIAPGAISDLGDVFLTAAGGLRLALSFPKGTPKGSLLASVLRGPPPGSLIPTRTPLSDRTMAFQRDLELSFQNLEPGVVILILQATADSFYAEQHVIIRPGQVTSVPLVFTPIAIAGLVSRARVPVEAATVEFARNQYRAKAIADADGMYSLVLWAPGEYLCLARAKEGEHPFPEAVTIADSATEFSHDILLPANSITGTVTDADTHQPVTTAKVQLQYAEGAAGKGGVKIDYAATPNSEGTYRFDNLPDQPSDLSVSAADYAPEQFRSVTPSEGGTRIDVALHRGIDLAGRVLDEAGNPVPNAFVGMDRNGASFQSKTATSATGEFTFRGAAPGTHAIAVYKCGYRMTAVVAQAQRDTDPVQVVIPPPLGTLTLHFENKQGRPLSHVAITAQANGVTLPTEYPSRFLMECGVSPFSDGTGDLVIDLLPQGVISLFAAPDLRLLTTFVNDHGPGQRRVVVDDR